MKKKLIFLLQFVLKFLSKAVIKKFNPVVIAVTGSVGKTSSKEAIWSVLKGYKNSRKTLANFNNELGVPLAILGDYQKISKPAWFFWIKIIFLSLFNILFKSKYSYPKILILEYGADKPGDISKLIDIAKPHIAVISAIGKIPVHVENYSQGIESVIKEKSKLISNLSVGDIAILNSDDPATQNLMEKTRAKVLTFGFSKNSFVKISNFKHLEENGKIYGVAFKLENQGASVPIILNGAFSVAHAYAAACASCVALTFDINLIGSANAFSSYYKPIKGRSVIMDGVKESQIIDESYNSSPTALETALISMKEIKDKRRIAVLGDMMELGNYTLEAHESVGKIIPECLDVLITVGPRAEFIAQSAIKNGMDKNLVFSFQNTQDAGLKLQAIIKKGDLILIKGSRVIGLDRIVEEVKQI